MKTPRTLRTKLTELRVERLKPDPAGRRVVMDDGPLAVRGFGVIVHPSGERVFIARYRTRGTRETSRDRRTRLGTFPELTVAEARDRARHEIAARDAGGDPAADKHAAKFAPALSVAFAEYLDHLRVGVKLKPSTLCEYKRQADKIILPVLGARKVTEVGTKDVATLHGETLSDRPYLANRVLALLAAFFRWTERRRLRPKDSNPCADVRAFSEERRERYLTGPELQRLGDALRRALDEGLPPTEARRQRGRRYAARLRAKRGSPRGPYDANPSKLTPANPLAVAAIRLLALTGWREQEVLSLRWNAVNLQTGRVNLRDTKTRQSFRTLSAPAVQALNELPRVVGSPFVFPGQRDGKPLTDIAHVWQSVRAVAGLEDVRLHDLRHNFASYGASALYSLPVLAKLLGHKDLASTTVYAHVSLATERQAADGIAREISAKMEGRKTRVTAISQRRARR
jgi:integrase